MKTKKNREIETHIKEKEKIIERVYKITTHLYTTHILLYKNQNFRERIFHPFLLKK